MTPSPKIWQIHTLLRRVHPDWRGAMNVTENVTSKNTTDTIVLRNHLLTLRDAIGAALEALSDKVEEEQ